MMDPEQKDMSRGDPRYEKQEKGQEKQEEKGQGLDEKYRRNPVRFVTSAVVLIWLGAFLLLQNQGIFTENDRGWAIFVWGAAGLFLVEVAIRLVAPRWRQPVVGTFILAAVLTGVGAGLWSKDNWEIIGPIILIAVGIVLVAGRLLPRR